MSSYNKRIIKGGTSSNQQPVHLNDRAVGTKEEYINETVKNIVDKMVFDAKNEIENEKERILNGLKQERETILTNAQEEGYTLGKEKAKDELREELNEEYEKARMVYEEANDHLKKVQEETQKKREQWMEESKEAIIELLVTSTETLLGKRVDSEDFDMENIIRQALLNIRNENEKIWIRIHPKTYALIKDKAIVEQHVEWLCDPILGLADVEIETKREFIDGKLESKINELKLLIREMVTEND